MILESIRSARLEALAEAAEKYVQHTFGKRLELKSIAPTNVPHFVLDRYQLWQGVLDGRSLILLAISERRLGATAEYLKHRDLVRRALGVDLILLLFDHVPNAVRRQMVERRTPGTSYPLPGTAAKDMQAFVDLATAEVDCDPRQFNMKMTQRDVGDRLCTAYQL